MTSLSKHDPDAFIKILYIGDSGTGKTSSLCSLVQAGYKIILLDLDNGVQPLKQLILRDCPELIDNVNAESRRDKPVSTPSGPIIRTPKAYTESLALMDKWSDGSIPEQLGDKYIFVLDSLTHYSRAAFNWAKGMNPSAKDPRQWYFQAQQAIESDVSKLTSKNFECNLIVISHVDIQERDDGTKKGYARTVGSALGPVIPTYFNTMILAETSGFGKQTKRLIKTVPTGLIDLKNPASWKFQSELPLETGLATIFAQLKDQTHA